MEQVKTLRRYLIDYLDSRVQDVEVEVVGSFAGFARAKVSFITQANMLNLHAKPPRDVIIIHTKTTTRHLPSNNSM